MLWGSAETIQGLWEGFGVAGVQFEAPCTKSGALCLQFEAKRGIWGWQGCEGEAPHCLWDRPRRTQSAQHTRGTTHLQDAVGWVCFSTFIKAQKAAALLSSPAPAAQQMENDRRSSPLPRGSQDQARVGCQGTDRDIPVCLQGLKGWDQKKQSQDGATCLQSPSRFPTDHSPLRI